MSQTIRTDDNISPESTEKTLVKVINANKISLSILLDVESNLDQIRIILQHQNPPLMVAGDYFISNDVVVNKCDEVAIKLSVVLKNENELYVGPRGSFNTIDDKNIFNGMNLDQKLFVLGSQNLNIYNGITIEKANTNLTLRQTHKKLYKFADNYVPNGINSDKTIDYEELYTFTEETHSMQYSGVTSTSVSLTVPYVSAESTFEYAKSKSHKDGKVNSYYTKRYLFKKVDLRADYDKLIVNEEFIGKIEDAIRGYEETYNPQAINGYENLVRVLNEYGWYAPIRYTLGGAIYSTEKSEVRTLEEAEKESKKFSAKVDAKAESLGISGGASHSNSETNESSHSSKDENKAVTFHQIGGNVDGKDNYGEWITSLNDPKYWRIISYDELMPSLLFLRGKHNQTLSICLRLLSKFHNYSNVMSLQPYIDVKDYESKIAYEINPIYNS